MIAGMAISLGNSSERTKKETEFYPAACPSEWQPAHFIASIAPILFFKNASCGKLE
jgi:hypothetical protein